MISTDMMVCILMVGLALVSYHFGHYRGYQAGVWDSVDIVDRIFDHLEEMDVIEYEDTEDT